MAPAAEQAPFRLVLAFIVEIARRAVVLEFGQIDFQFLEAAHVFVLCGLTRLDGLDAALERFADDVSDVAALLAELLGHRGGEAALDVADIELVREAVLPRAVQALRTFRPVAVDRKTAPARSEQRRVGKEGVSTCRFRWW